MWLSGTPTTARSPSDTTDNRPCVFQRRETIRAQHAPTRSGYPGRGRWRKRQSGSQNFCAKRYKKATPQCRASLKHDASFVRRCIATRPENWSNTPRKLEQHAQKTGTTRPENWKALCRHRDHLERRATRTRVLNFSHDTKPCRTAEADASTLRLVAGFLRCSQVAELQVCHQNLALHIATMCASERSGLHGDVVRDRCALNSLARLWILSTMFTAQIIETAWCVEFGEGFHMDRLLSHGLLVRLGGEHEIDGELGHLAAPGGDARR